MEKKGEDIPLLVAQTGPLNGLRWPLRDSLVIGREPSCEIEIPDRQVSRQHARNQRDPQWNIIRRPGKQKRNALQRATHGNVGFIG